MKVLFAHDHTFYRFKNEMFSTGGLSNQMLKRYLKSFDELTIISRQKKAMNEQVSNLTKASGEKINFVNINNFKKLTKIHLRFSELKKIEEEVIKTDYLIARIPSSIGEIAIKFAEKHKKPYLIEVVACPWDSLWNHSVLGKVIAPYAYLKTKKIVKKAPFCVYVTSDFLQKRYPNKGVNTNCSNVNISKNNHEILQQRIEKIKKQSDHTFLIGTTAAVNVKYKGQKYIIEAVGKLKSKGIDNIQYCLVGGGDQKYLKKIARKNKVEDQIVFLGGLNHDEVLKWLTDIDLYIQPSLQEGLPRALIEAMSKGLPSLGTKRAGIPELIPDDSLVDVNRHTSNSFEQLILTLINDKELQIKYSNMNFEKAKEFEHNKIEKRRQDFFKKFIKEYS